MARIKPQGPHHPVCKHYLASGECAQLPVVRIYHGPTPANATTETREFSEVQELCPHAGDAPEWLWHQQTCAMYEKKDSRD